MCNRPSYGISVLNDTGWLIGYAANERDSVYCSLVISKQKILTSRNMTTPNNVEFMKKDKSLALGIALGIAIGTAIGVATDNLGLWISLGIALGATIGTTLLKKYKKDSGDTPNMKGGTE